MSTSSTNNNNNNNANININDASSSSSSTPAPPTNNNNNNNNNNISNLTNLPPELHISILTHLRATDLSSLQRTCTTFHSPHLISTILHQFATVVYPPELTEGYDTPMVGGEVNVETGSCVGFYASYEPLRNMEMLVVARVLSRPEPSFLVPGGGGGAVCRAVNGGGDDDGGCSSNGAEYGFYVSKSWCRTALRWLESQAEERKEREELRWRKREEEQQRKRQQQLEEEEGATTNGGKKKKKYQHKAKPGTPNTNSGKKKSKKAKREERRKKSNGGRSSNSYLAQPPSPNVNNDLVCEHGALICDTAPNNNNNNNNNNLIPQYTTSTRRSRGKRRLLDRQAWKILKKLYPDATQLPAINGECIQCALDAETTRRNEEARRMKEEEERRRPLGCKIIRGIYGRNRGVPVNCMVDLDGVHSSASSSSLVASLPSSKTTFHDHATLSNGGVCPLKPGIYNVLPRIWCHRWRKYLKSGGQRPSAPDTSTCLCDGHKLPLIPPHLQAFLYGDTSALLTTSSYEELEKNRLNGDGIDNNNGGANVATLSGRMDSMNLNNNNEDMEMLQTLRASGLTNAEIEQQRTEFQHYQRLLLQNEERRRSRQEEWNEYTEEERRSVMNEQLDRENRVVVEILTEEEYGALERWWPEIHSSYSLKFMVMESEVEEDEENVGGLDEYGRRRGRRIDGGRIRKMTEIMWTTPPCRECDASGSAHTDFKVRNRCRSWANNTPQKRK